MAKTERRDHTPEKKAEIVRRHLVDGVPVSDLCDDVWRRARSSTPWHGRSRSPRRACHGGPSGRSELPKLFF